MNLIDMMATKVPQGKFKDLCLYQVSKDELKGLRYDESLPWGFRNLVRMYLEHPFMKLHETTDSIK